METSEHASNHEPLDYQHNPVDRQGGPVDDYAAKSGRFHYFGPFHPLVKDAKKLKYQIEKAFWPETPKLRSMSNKEKSEFRKVLENQPVIKLLIAQLGLKPILIEKNVELGI